MQITRRTAVIAGTAGAVAVAGLLIAGPAFARGGHGGGFGMESGTATTGGPLRPMGSVDTGTVGGPGMMGAPGMHGDGDFRGGMMAGRTIHSSGVAAQTDASGNTTYVKVSSQQGTVVSSSSSSIVVKSADGVTWTWKVDASTQLIRNGALAKATDFAAGETVEVAGSGTGDGSTAAFVMAGGMGGPGGRGMHGDGDGDFGHGMGGGPAGAGAGTLTPMPTQSSSSTSA